MSQEDHKFSVKDVTTANSIKGVDIAADAVDAPTSTNDTTSIVKTIDDFSNKSIEEAPNENDQPKHRSDGKKTFILIVTPVPPAESTKVSTESHDGNPSNVSVDNQPNRNDQRVKQKKPPRRHTCKKCNRSFNRPSKLNLHIQSVHKGIRDHVCKDCGKRYVRLRELKEHVRTHTGMNTLSRLPFDSVDSMSLAGIVEHL